jgi:hypothetical protein
MVEESTSPGPLFAAPTIPPLQDFSYQRAQALKCTWTGRWSWGNTPRDVNPAERQGGLAQFTDDLLRVHWINVKDGPVCIPATFRNGEGRSKAAIESIWLLGFDIDRGQEGDVQRTLEVIPTCAVLHSTFSDGEEKDGRRVARFRIFVPLRRTVSIEEHRVLWRWMCDRITTVCGDAIDSAAKDPGRLFYTIRTNRQEPWLQVQPGEPLDPDALPDGSNVSERVEERKRKKPNDNGPPEDACIQAGMGHFALHLLRRAARTVAAADVGERNAILNCQAYSVGQFVGAGLLERERANLALVEAGLITGLPIEEVENVVRRAMEAGEQNPRHTGHARPQIAFIQGSDLSDRAWAVVQHLRTLNDPPYLFLRERELVRLVHYKGEAYIDVLTTSSLRTLAMELARFAEERVDKEGKKSFRGCDLPLTVAEYIANLDGLPFPNLDAVVTSPIFTPTGKLLSEDGYDPELGVYVSLGGATIREVPSSPTSEDVEWAKDLLINHLLQGFPLVGSASLAHALAIGFLPFVRFMINGPTPLHLISAPTAGTGKSLLAEAMAIISTGRSPEVLAECSGEDEFRKHATAKLNRNAAAFILLDNASKKFAGAVLASIITATVWSDRRLGQTSIITVRNLATWVATANQPKSSGELARRIVWVQLDGQLERPWDRDAKEFKHHPLIPWVQENRAELQRAFLILVQNWIASGMPKASCPPKGSFEAYSNVLSPILECAGISGFLENQGDFYEQANDEAAEWGEFVQAWWSSFRDNSVGSHQLVELAMNLGLLVQVIRDGTANSQSMRMAKAVKARLDRVIGGYKLGRGDYDGHRKAHKYRLVPPGPSVVDHDDPPPEPPQPEDELYERLSREARAFAGNITCEPGLRDGGHNAVNTNRAGIDRHTDPHTPATTPEIGSVTPIQGLAGVPGQTPIIPQIYMYPVINHWDDER